MSPTVHAYFRPEPALLAPEECPEAVATRSAIAITIGYIPSFSVIHNTHSTILCGGTSTICRVPSKFAWIYLLYIVSRCVGCGTTFVHSIVPWALGHYKHRYFDYSCNILPHKLCMYRLPADNHSHICKRKRIRKLRGLQYSRHRCYTLW